MTTRKSSRTYGCTGLYRSLGQKENGAVYSKRGYKKVVKRTRQAFNEALKQKVEVVKEILKQKY